MVEGFDSEVIESKVRDITRQQHIAVQCHQCSEFPISIAPCAQVRAQKASSRKRRLTVAQKQDRVRRLDEQRVVRELTEPAQRRNSKLGCDSNAATAQSSEACTAIVPVVVPPLDGVAPTGAANPQCGKQCVPCTTLRLPAIRHQ